MKLHSLIVSLTKFTSYETGLLEISLDYNVIENLPQNRVGHILAIGDIHNLFLQKKNRPRPRARFIKAMN